MDSNRSPKPGNGGTKFEKKACGIVRLFDNGFCDRYTPAVVPSPPDDRRPPMVVAMQMVSRITTVSLIMVLPAVAGHWCDGKWGTGPWLVSAGAILGMTAGMYHLLQFTGEERKSDPRHKRNDSGS